MQSVISIKYQLTMKTIKNPHDRSSINNRIRYEINSTRNDVNTFQ